MWPATCRSSESKKKTLHKPQNINCKPTVTAEVMMNNSASMRRSPVQIPTEYANSHSTNQAEMKNEPKSPTAKQKQHAFSIQESIRPQMSMQFNQLPNTQIPSSSVASINAQILNFQAKQEAERQHMMSLLLASGNLGAIENMRGSMNQFNPQMAIRSNQIQNQSIEAARLNLLQAHQAQALFLQHQQRIRSNALVLQDMSNQYQLGQQYQMLGGNCGNFQQLNMPMHQNMQAAFTNHNSFIRSLQGENNPQMGSMFSHIMNPTTLKAFAEHNRATGITTSAGSAFERNLKKEVKPFCLDGTQQNLI